MVNGQQSTVDGRTRFARADARAERPYKYSDYYGHGMPCPYKPSVTTITTNNHSDAQAMRPYKPSVPTNTLIIADTACRVPTN